MIFARIGCRLPVGLDAHAASDVAKGPGCRVRPSFVAGRAIDGEAWSPSSLNPFAPRTVHPHARGEHLEAKKLKGQDYGSSPRAWGTPACALPVLRHRRFIPTRVGNTRCRPKSLRRRSVHPHARGEHATVLGLRGTGSGSSPRAWGTHDPWVNLLYRWRFIPTRVGNTCA